MGFDAAPQSPARDTRRAKQSWFWILATAIAITALDVAKPLYMDDAAFFHYAQQISRHPLDPYGFSFMWMRPCLDPANYGTAPPVLLYWWAIAIKLFGYSSPWAWKLWMFPFALLLCFSVSFLLDNFEIEPKSTFLCLIVISPWILPFMNMMMDVPVLALCLTGFVLFIKACRADSWRWAIATGIVLGLAMETKYTALLFPLTLFAWVVTMAQSQEARNRRMGFWLLATAIAFGIFTAFECWTAGLYGTSHFMMKIKHPPDRFGQYSFFAASLPKLLGGIGPFLLMTGIIASGVGKRWLLLPAYLVIVQYAMFFIPASPKLYALFSPFIISISQKYQYLLGLGFLVLLGLWFLVELRRLIVKNARDACATGDRSTLFLTVWCCIELFNYFQTSPFPAVRRIMGLSTATGFLAGRLASLKLKQNAGYSLALHFIVIGQAAVALLFCYVDYLDAKAEKDLAASAVRVIRASSPGAPIWYTGIFGFQFYAEQAGMKPVIPNQSIIHSNEFFVIPTYGILFPINHIPKTAKKVFSVGTKDNMPLTTIGSYGGSPIDYHDPSWPRAQADIYRATKSFIPQYIPE